MPNQPLLYSFPAKDELSAAVVTYILAAQDAALEKHEKFRVAVSGGSVPAFLRNLASNPETEWGKWDIFFADERAVPHNHEDSNYGLLKKELLDHIPAGSERPTVVPIDESLLDDTQELADAYEHALVREFAARETVKVPVFDLIILGCGPDGHTCSLFPGHELLREQVAWVAPIEDSPKPPPRRITLTLPVVAHATRVIFIAAGAGKAEVLRTIFDQPEEGLPCSIVNEMCGDRVSWFCDAPATEGVAFPKKSNL